MSIQVGDKIPAVKLKHLTDNGMQDIATDELFANKTVVLFSVPGAFTPTCSARHLPGFVDKAADLSAKGVDTVVCTAVNDPFVMQAWAEKAGAADKVEMLPDGSAAFIKELGLDLDLTANGMGVRGKRFALIAKDGVVTHLAIEEPGQFGVSSAESVLAAL